MGVPGLLKLLQSLYFEYDSGLHNNKKIIEKLKNEEDIDVYIDYNSLLYLFKNSKELFIDSQGSKYIIDTIFYEKMRTILEIFYGNLKEKSYKSYIFIDGVPSYNKILNQKKNKIFEKLVSVIEEPLNTDPVNYNLPTIDNIKNDNINLIQYLQKNDFHNFFEFLKTIKPGTYIFEYIQILIKNIFEEFYNLKYFSSSSENDEAEIKLLRFMKFNNLKNNIKVVLSPDADLIYQLIILHIKYKVNNIYLCMIKQDTDKETKNKGPTYITYISIDILSQQIINDISYIYKNITCNYKMYKILKLNEDENVTLTNITTADIITITKNSINNKYELKIGNTTYYIEKIFNNKLFYNGKEIDMKDYDIDDNKITNDNSLMSDFYGTIKFSEDNKGQAEFKNNNFKKINSNNILFYIMYYNDGIIYNNNNIDEKLYDKEILNNMLLDIIFLFTFYGNDFTLTIPTMIINKQSFISILIIYIRSFIEFNKDKNDKNDIIYLTKYDINNFFTKDDNDNLKTEETINLNTEYFNFFKLIINYLAKYEDLYINCLIPDIINNSHNINLNYYNTNKIFYKYKIVNTSYFISNKSDNRKTYELSTNEPYKINDFIKFYEEYYNFFITRHNTKLEYIKDINFIFNKIKNIENNQYIEKSSEEILKYYNNYSDNNNINCYIKLLQWIYNSYYEYKVGNYVHNDLRTPFFNQLYNILGNIETTIKYKTENHYEMSKIEQFMNQSLLVKENNEIINNNESSYFTNKITNNIPFYNNINVIIKKIYNKYDYFNKKTIKDILIEIRNSVKKDVFNKKYELNLNNTFIKDILYCVNRYSKECYLMIPPSSQNPQKPINQLNIQSLSQLQPQQQKNQSQYPQQQNQPFNLQTQQNQQIQNQQKKNQSQNIQQKQQQQYQQQPQQEQYQYQQPQQQPQNQQQNLLQSQQYYPQQQPQNQQQNKKK